MENLRAVYHAGVRSAVGCREMRRLVVAVVFGLWFFATSSASAQALQVYTKPIEPFSFERDGKALGFSIDLWDRVAQKMGVKYEIHWVKSVSDLIQALDSKQADIGVAAISITAEREAKVDFSTPFYESGLGVLVKARGKGAMSVIADALFSKTVLWFCLALFGILLVVAHLIWFFERHANPDQFPKAYVRGVWESAWWAISTILSGGCDAKGPVVVIGRLVAAFWMLLCIIVITYFTAAITTIMTVNQLSSDIRGIGDLPGKQVATVKGSTAERYLQEHGMKVNAFETIDGAYKALEGEKVVAVVYDQPILDYHIKMAGGSDEQVVGRLFQRQNYGIGLQQGSPYRKQINSALLQLREEGVIDELHDKWFGSDN
jgi:polar amino acid transport system substrate-binding protein